MGGGGKGGGGGPKIPEFVKESQKSVSEKSKQLYDITKPAMAEATKQLQSLITTGGPGAQVPIISNMEEAQRRAFATAMPDIRDQMVRAGGGETVRTGAIPAGGGQVGGGKGGGQEPAIKEGKGGKGGGDEAAPIPKGGPGQAGVAVANVTDPSYRRILEQANIDQQAGIRGLAPQIAGPLVSSTMGASLGGLGLAQQGYQSAAQALASGVRRPQAGSGKSLLDAGKTFADLYSTGAFKFGGGGGNFN